MNDPRETLNRISKMSDIRDRLANCWAIWNQRRDDARHLLLFVNFAEDLLADGQSDAAREVIEQLRRIDPLFFKEPANFGHRLRKYLWPETRSGASKRTIQPQGRDPSQPLTAKPGAAVRASTRPGTGGRSTGKAERNGPLNAESVTIRESLPSPAGPTLISDRASARTAGQSEAAAAPTVLLPRQPIRAADPGAPTIHAVTQGAAARTENGRERTSTRTSRVGGVAGLPRAGEQVGEWILDEPVGRGSFGIVYRAHNAVITDMHVAIKFLAPLVERDPGARRRFIQEARAAWHIDHENVIRILGVSETPQGRPFVVMELLEGWPLTAEMRSGTGGARRVKPERAAFIASGIARALTAAHAKQIVHRDLKPDNIFVIPRPGAPNLIKVLDFGVARIRGELSAAVRTAANIIIGTPGYMSPEQCKGLEVDARSDLYSLGVVLYECLAGVPYAPGDVATSIQVHLAGSPVSFPAADVPPQLQKLVRLLLSVQPERRPATAEEVVKQLEAFLQRSG